MEASSANDVDEQKHDLEPVKTICRCCLTTDKRVQSISLFASFFLDLAGLNVSESDGLPPWLCYECSGLLQKSVSFKRKLLKANTMLCDYLMRCAPFPIDAEDPELSKYATPNLSDTYTLTFDNTGKAKAGFQKVLEHEKRHTVTALDAIAIDLPEAKKADNTSEQVKLELESLSDYEDNITLDEFRTNAEKAAEEPIATNSTNDIKTEAEENIPKKKKKTKKAGKDGKHKEKRKRLDNGIVYRLGEETKREIVSLHQKGVPVVNIADELGVTRNTVYLWTKRWENEGTIQPRTATGRPRKTTEAQDQALLNTVRHQNYMNYTLLAAPLEVSSNTIRRRLHENGLKKSVQRNNLTDWQKKMRLEFAQKYLNYDFQNVAFLSEKIFVINDDGISISRTNVKFENAEVIGFFGFMNSNGPVLLTGVDSRLTTEDYIRILRELFLPSARKVYPENYKIHFAHDFSSMHNSRRVEAFVRAQENLDFIKLPPKCMDLNPMERIWIKLVEDIDLTRKSTNQQLWSHVMDRWSCMRGSDICKTLVNSMKERLQAVIDADGAYTKF